MWHKTIISAVYHSKQFKLGIFIITWNIFSFVYPVYLIQWMVFHTVNACLYFIICVYKSATIHLQVLTGTIYGSM